MEDKWIHALLAIAMVGTYYQLPVFIMVPLAVCIHWYCWELAQRIAKDKVAGEGRGFDYWWDMRRWGNTAQQEVIYPVIAATIFGTILAMV